MPPFVTLVKNILGYLSILGNISKVTAMFNPAEAVGGFVIFIYLGGFLSSVQYTEVLLVALILYSASIAKCTSKFNFSTQAASENISLYARPSQTPIIDSVSLTENKTIESSSRTTKPTKRPPSSRISLSPASVLIHILVTSIMQFLAYL